MRDGKVLLHQAVGWADKEHGVPMTVDSILAPPPAERRSPGSVGDIFWGGITGPRYFMDPEQRLIGLLWMLRPSERAAVHAEFRAMVYGALQPAQGW